MKRYLLFAGDDYYPGGGWKDFICSRDTIDEIKALCSWVKEEDKYWMLKIDHDDWECDSSSGQWLHIVDRDTGDIVFAECSDEK